MNHRMSAISRIIAAICALALVGPLFLPIWRIELTAPQYPEGLVLKIYAAKLGGDVEVVNGLNHYIGMRSLHEKDFVEFQVLPYIIGALIFFGLLSALINRKWFFYMWVGFIILFAATALIDFYRWEYNYGHNLDPSAPIQVTGMSYQPPLIGYKQLLNFGAFSIPDAGGWLFTGSGLLLAIVTIVELRRNKRADNRMPVMAVTALVTCMMLLNSCSSGPQPIRFGSDGCHFCKMAITDKHFGGEVITSKGKLYKFDDLHCLASFLKSNSIDEKTRSDIYLVDFSTNGQLIKAGESFLLQSEVLHGPMGSTIAAFANEDSMQRFKLQFKGTVIDRNELFK